MPLTIGTLVLQCDEDISSKLWKRGRVVKLYTGKDGVARSADVFTSSGTYKRPVSKLAVLDIVSDGGESSPESVHGGGDVID